MDPVTHFLTGACLARTGFNRKAAYATLAMTLAAEAPDLDVLWSVRGPVAGFEHHRGITHTLIAAPFMALAAVGVVWIIHTFRTGRFRNGPPKAPVRWGLLWLFALIAHLSHLLLDFTNNYGLRPFFPFNPRWYSWDIVFIVEPLMLAALFLGLVVPWLLGLADREIGARRDPFRGRGWAIAAISFLVLLYAVRNAEHVHAINLVRNNGMTAEPALRIHAEPEPVNPFKWYTITETASAYQTAMVNTRSDQIDAEAGELLYKPPVTLSTLSAKRSWLGRVYMDWSQIPFVEDRGAITPPGYKIDAPLPDWHTVQFRDLRFGYPIMSTRPAEAALSGWVYVDEQREIEGMFMSGKEQH